MNSKMRICVAGISAALCAAGAFCACDNTPPEKHLPEPPAIEYTVDENDLTRDANGNKFYAQNVQKAEFSMLSDKTFYWLGSSVTYGASSGGESMADFLAAKTGAVCRKDAVSGTTIFDDGATENTGIKSYTRRLTNSTVFKKDEHVDAFICQISTNDAISYRLEKRGYVTDISITDKEDFDLATTMGGVEYIIAYAAETWNCPVYFYSGSYFGDVGSGETRTNKDPSGTAYAKLVEDVKVAIDKWQNLGYEVDVIDMFNDKDFNATVSDEYYKWCTGDPIHPKRAGYLNWWMPYFEQYLIVKLCDY